MNSIAEGGGTPGCSTIRSTWVLFLLQCELTPPSASCSPAFPSDQAPPRPLKGSRALTPHHMAGTAIVEMIGMAAARRRHSCGRAAADQLADGGSTLHRYTNSHELAAAASSQVRERGSRRGGVRARLPSELPKRSRHTEHGRRRLGISAGVAKRLLCSLGVCSRREARNHDGSRVVVKRARHQRSRLDDHSMGARVLGVERCLGTASRPQHLDSASAFSRHLVTSSYC